MRIAVFLFMALLTAGLVYILDTTRLLPAPLGKLLSPQQGVWQNAEPVNNNFSDELKFPKLKGKAHVYLDENLVPHVFAENGDDLYFIQGYLHAKFRLWQMEFQVRAAAGRLSEILGAGDNNAILNYDRGMRRLGMVYGAENAMPEIEGNPITKSITDSYTDGVNSFIEDIDESQLPLEYKLLGQNPEKWNTLKTALLFQYMALDLAGHEDDFEHHNAASVFPKEVFEKLYPLYPDSLDPIIPRGTPFLQPGLALNVPSTADSLFYPIKDTIGIRQTKPDKDNGSNNWAVAGSKTKSGRPILCNDPHLGLNLPSLWFEMQLHSPTHNMYGVSLPGAPGIIIGFNDYCAIGLTNAGRDVRDYYEMKFKDDSRKEYQFNGRWKASTFRIEEFKIKGAAAYYDTVVYTSLGPVMYDASFTGQNRVKNNKNYVVYWLAHHPGNTPYVIHQLNQAKNYDDYVEALRYFVVPAQNFLFASKTGDIAIWQNGKFPARWKGQGDFVMPGTDSAYLWQGFIPHDENPHLMNPSRGFLSSANQLPVDSAYPYYLGFGSDYPVYRGVIINRMLSKMNNITPDDMQKMQVDNYNVFAETARPVLLKYIKEDKLNAEESKYLSRLKKWNLRSDPAEGGPVIFNVWFDSLENAVWGDEFAKIKGVYKWPQESTLIDNIIKDSAFSFIDNINTPDKETINDVVTIAFQHAVPSLQQLERDDVLSWAKFKGTGIRHLLRLPALSRMNLPVGGGSHIINATKDFHGPSWRMVVQLTDETEAYGIYPGGQSGNPGSRYYDSFVNTWAAGKYKKLWVMKENETADKRVKWKMSFTK